VTVHGFGSSTHEAALLGWDGVTVVDGALKLTL
jgi:hypothetical protein